jgi:hypothetical protein
LSENGLNTLTVLAALANDETPDNQQKKLTQSLTPKQPFTTRSQTCSEQTKKTLACVSEVKVAS